MRAQSCRPWQSTLVQEVSVRLINEQVQLWVWAQSAKACNSATDMVVPVGLLGLQMLVSLVSGRIAAAIQLTSIRNPLSKSMSTHETSQPVVSAPSMLRGYLGLLMTRWSPGLSSAVCTK